MDDMNKVAKILANTLVPMSALSGVTAGALGAVAASSESVLVVVGVCMLAVAHLASAATSLTLAIGFTRLADEDSGPR